MGTLIVSGATGALGSRFLDKMKGTNLSIIALERNKGSIKKEGNIIPMTMDEFFALDEKIQSLEVLNLAFPRKSDSESVMEGIIFTRRFIDKCTELGAKRIINVSSQSVYDSKRRNKAFESDITMPFNMYGVGKDYLEKWIDDWAEKKGLEVVHARLASLVGEEFPKRITSRMVSSAINNREIKVMGENNLFSFLHLEDAAKALEKIVINKKHFVGIYNVGSKEEYTLLDIAAEIKKEIHDVRVNVVDKEVEYQNRSLSVLKIKNEFDWEAVIGLEDIIKEEVNNQKRGDKDE